MPKSPGISSLTLAAFRAAEAMTASADDLRAVADVPRTAQAVRRILLANADRLESVVAMLRTELDQLDPQRGILRKIGSVGLAASGALLLAVASGTASGASQEWTAVQIRAMNDAAVKVAEACQVVETSDVWELIEKEPGEPESVHLRLLDIPERVQIGVLTVDITPDDLGVTVVPIEVERFSSGKFAGGSFELDSVPVHINVGETVEIVTPPDTNAEPRVMRLTLRKAGLENVSRRR